MKKASYLLFILLSVLLIFCFLVTTVNFNIFSKSSFNFSTTFKQVETTSLSTSSEIEDFVSRAMGYLPGEAKKMEDSGSINSTHSRDIIENTNRAYDYFSSYKSGNSRDDLYRSLFYSQLAFAYYHSYPFINCAENVLDTAEKYRPLFFYLSESDRVQIEKIRNAQQRLENYLAYDSHYIEDNSTILSRARSSTRVESDFDLYQLKCVEFKNYLNKDYRRQLYWFWFKVSALVISLLAGFIAGISIMTIQNSKGKVNRTLRFLELVWSPKEIKLTTIESILKINSVAAVLIAFLSISINVSGFNNLIVIGAIFISVLSVLSSLVLGIISLNNEDSKIKLYCYRLFIFGMGWFVIFFIYLICAGIISIILNNVGEAARTYLNNQTLIK